MQLPRYECFPSFWGPTCPLLIMVQLMGVVLAAGRWSRSAPERVTVPLMGKISIFLSHIGFGRGCRTSSSKWRVLGHFCKLRIFIEIWETIFFRGDHPDCSQPVCQSLGFSQSGPWLQHKKTCFSWAFNHLWNTVTLLDLGFNSHLFPCSFHEIRAFL